MQKTIDTIQIVESSFANNNSNYQLKQNVQKQVIAQHDFSNEELGGPIIQESVETEMRASHSRMNTAEDRRGGSSALKKRT